MVGGEERGMVGGWGRGKVNRLAWVEGLSGFVAGAGSAGLGVWLGPWFLLVECLVFWGEGCSNDEYVGR